MYSGDRLVLSVEPGGSFHTVLSKWGLVDSMDDDTTLSSRMSCPPLGNAEAICMLVSISQGLLVKLKIEFYKFNFNRFFFKDNLNVFTDTMPFDSYIYMSWHSWVSFVRSKRCILLTWLTLPKWSVGTWWARSYSFLCPYKTFGTWYFLNTVKVIA